MPSSDPASSSNTAAAGEITAPNPSRIGEIRTPELSSNASEGDVQFDEHRVTQSSIPESENTFNSEPIMSEEMMVVALSGDLSTTPVGQSTNPYASIDMTSDTFPAENVIIPITEISGTDGTRTMPGTTSSSSAGRSSKPLRHTQRDVPVHHQPLSFYTPSSFQESAAQEHFRDIRGPVTLHRLLLLAFLVGVSYGILVIQNLVWPPTSVPHDRVWTSLCIILFVPLPSVIAWIVGALWFKHNVCLDTVAHHDHKVVFRIVSRGTNSECLLATVRHCQAELEKAHMFPYLIEIVTDGEGFESPDAVDVIHLRVPNHYTPPNGSKFKARALHYACIASQVPDDAWVVHLDEETQLTTSAIKGIADMVAQCESSGNVKRVGQGCILYHRSWATHPFLTLADMRRTGDDIGHFHLQHRLGITIFGLHGSYVVVRADVEREIGFDVGPDGSITEDAWWILLAVERGVRTCWVDGYMEEQSTQSVTDFMKQRRRWYVGLWKVGVKCPVPFRLRALLLYNTLCWIILPIVLPLQVLYVVLSIVYEKQILFAIRLLTSIMAATSFAVYLSGLCVNMWEHGTPIWRAPMWIILQILLFPFFYIMEAIAILMTLFSPLSENAKGFHVVQKSNYPDRSSDSSSPTTGSDGEGA